MRSSRARDPLQKRADESRGNLSVLLWGGIICTGVGALGVGTYLSSVGGLTYLLQAIYGLRGNPSLYAGAYNMLRPGLFLLVAWALVRNKRSRTLWAGLLVFVCFDLIWFGPLNGSRNQIISLVLTLFYISRYIRGQASSAAVSLLRRRWLIAAGVAFGVGLGGATRVLNRGYCLWQR